MNFMLRKATVSDIEPLLQLYFLVYGLDYPLELGTNRGVMRSLIESMHAFWLVAEDDDKRILGSVVVEMDENIKIGRVEGLVVHPEARRHKLSSRLVDRVVTELLEAEGSRVNSLYATTRTLALGPQMVFLKRGFLPLGIFPNAHKLKDFETLTLLAKFRDGVLERRMQVDKLPGQLSPIVSLIAKKTGANTLPEFVAAPQGEIVNDELEFEIIYAPAFVQRRFLETFPDPYDRFYPFHTPNMLMTSKNGEVEIYAYFSKNDGYCTIVALTKPVKDLRGRLRGLLGALRDYGLSYLEILMSVDRLDSLFALLDAQFLPSAYYPAMFERDEKMIDFVLMSRTLEPLNFRDIQIDAVFKPFVDQYLELWKQMHLDVLGVFHDET